MAMENVQIAQELREFNQEQAALVEDLKAVYKDLTPAYIEAAVANANIRYHDIWSNPFNVEILNEKVCPAIFTTDNLCALSDSDMVIYMNAEIRKHTKDRSFPRITTNWFKRLLKKYESDEPADTIFFDNFTGACVFVESYRLALSQAKLWCLKEMKASKFGKGYDIFSFILTKRFRETFGDSKDGMLELQLRQYENVDNSVVNTTNNNVIILRPPADVPMITNEQDMLKMEQEILDAADNWVAKEP